ncbi:MAG: glycosyltransferase [Pyrinomonadaceae bacterium]
MKIVFLGLSITSSWGNGHATTYRGLVRELAARGHDVLFLERDVTWYASNRDMPAPPFCRTELYGSLDELRAFENEVREASCVVVGSYVPDGIEVGKWVLDNARGVIAFYDIDTPVTLSKLRRGDHEYISPELIREYDLYLSFTGGPTLDLIEQKLGSPAARPLYCSADETIYFPERATPRWDLGYMGTYSDDRQPALERLLIEPARRLPELKFVVAGPQFPDTIDWPSNVERIEHLPPSEHRAFYNSQRFTLNITRQDMVRAGYSPSVRLFEAGACGVPVISDTWEGIDTFFRPGIEIALADTSDDVVDVLTRTSEEARLMMGLLARQRVLKEHTATRRTAELEMYINEVRGAEAYSLAA